MTAPLLTLAQTLDDCEMRILAAAARSRAEMHDAITYAHGMAHGYFMAGASDRTAYLAASERVRDIAAQAERTFNMLAERHQEDPMLQRQVRHSSGTFALCRQCGREPRHIEARGSHSGEALDAFHPTGTRHALECACGARTPWLSDFHAVRIWWRAIARGGGSIQAPCHTAHKRTISA